MKLKDLLIEKTKTIPEYLSNLGIEFEMNDATDGYEITLKTSPNKTKNIVDDLLLVPEFSKYSIGYVSGSTIIVKQ